MKVTWLGGAGLCLESERARILINGVPAGATRADVFLFTSAHHLCRALKELHVLCEAAPMCSADIADADVYATTVLRVPQGCVGEYGFARVWERFGNVEELM